LRLLADIFGKFFADSDVGREVAGLLQAKPLDLRELRFAFEHAGLHRVQAAVVPRNAASARVLEKAGFHEEGLARRYLLINGAWEDHVLFALLAEDWAR